MSDSNGHHHNPLQAFADKSAPTHEVAPLYDDKDSAVRKRQMEFRSSESSDGTSGHFTFGDVLKGSAAPSLTAFERKAALVNAELDKFGMGKYQIFIWFLCGFGYLLDLMFAEAFALIATPLYQEMNVPAKAQGYIFTANSAGLTAGAFVFGILVDIIGRRWAFNLTCLITAVFGMLVAAPVNNYNAVCALVALCGFGLGGQIPIDAAITLEYLPQNRRNLLSLLSIFQPLGVVVCCAVAFGTVPKYRCDVNLKACSAVAAGEACCKSGSNMGWRYLLIILGCICLTVFFLRFFVFKFQESPKFLVGKGREQEAIDVLHKIARYNGAPPPTITMEDFRAIDREMGEVDPEAGQAHLTVGKVVKRGFLNLKHLKGLFKSPLAAFITIIIWLAYIGDYWSFNLAGSYLPIILARNNVSTGTQTVTDTYRQYIYIYLPGILGAIMAMAATQLPVIGRKWSLVLGAGIQGLSMAMYTQVKTTAGYVGLNALEYIMQTFFNAVLYASTPELFPAYVRGSACGLASMMGRLSGIVAPFAAAKYLNSNSGGILWLAAGGIWMSMLVLIFLPVEMRNRQSY